MSSWGVSEYKICSECGGMGTLNVQRTLTLPSGTKIKSMEVINCPVCMGYGYTNKEDESLDTASIK